MKRNLTVILFCGWAISLQSQTAFDEANEQFRQAHFSEATAIYHQIEAEGFENDALFYNLGNAYFRQNKMGKAILYYHKTLKVNPNHSDAAHNLLLAEKRVVDKFQPVPTPPIQQVFADVSSVGSTDFWAITGLGFMLLGVVFFALFVFGKRRTLISTMAAACIIIGALFQGMAYGKQQLSHQMFAILQQQNVYVKSAPANSAQDLYIIHEGAKLRVHEEFEGWAKVTLPDGRPGWLPTDSYEKI